MSTTNRYGSVKVTDALSVIFVDDQVHLTLAAHVHGAFLSSGMLVKSDIARKLADALNAMADASDAAVTPDFNPDVQGGPAAWVKPKRHPRQTKPER